MKKLTKKQLSEFSEENTKTIFSTLVDDATFESNDFEILEKGGLFYLNEESGTYGPYKEEREIMLQKLQYYYKEMERNYTFYAEMMNLIRKYDHPVWE